MTKLKPCPNPECVSSRPTMVGVFTDHYRVECLGCRMCGPQSHDEEKAGGLWDALPRTGG